MGRFASTVEFYARYREPYPPAFFSQIAHHLALSHREALLDVGCGPAPLAIGLSPFVAHCTGVDPEAAMIAAASTAAAQAGVSLSLVHARLEDFSPADTFDIVTIGRALHWLDRATAPPLLERMTSPSARILVCGAATVDSPVSPWKKPYDDLRHSYAKQNENERDRLDGKEWFAQSSFDEVTTISVRERRSITVADLVGRALSKSYTSPAMLGDSRARFETELIAILEPFAPSGVLYEEVVARAAVFARGRKQGE